MRSRVARTTPSRHSIRSGIGCSPYSAAWPGADAPCSPRQHAVDHAPRPQRAGVDVEIVEGLARIAVDGALLRLQDDVVLVVDAPALVDMGALQIPGQLIVVGAESAHEIPEIMAARLGLGRDGGEEGAVDALRTVALRRPGPRRRDADVADHHRRAPGR